MFLERLPLQVYTFKRFFRPFLVSATEIVDNIVVYANENKRKDELSKHVLDILISYVLTFLCYN